MIVKLIHHDNFFGSKSYEYLTKYINYAIYFTIVLGITLFFNLSGETDVVDFSLMDAQFALMQRAPTDSLVIVEIDSRSIEELAAWPWPRNYHAEVLNNLFAAGADTVAINVDFSSRSTDAADKALAEALGQHAGQVILSAFIQNDPDRGGAEIARITLPNALFRENVLLGAANVHLSPDGLVRRLPQTQGSGVDAIPSLASQLAHIRDSVGRISYLDYGIRIHDVRHISYVDVLRKNFDANIFINKRVIIGTTAIELGNKLPTPHYKALSGTLIQALSYETLAQHRSIQRSGPYVGFAIAALLLLLVGALSDWRRHVLVALSGLVLLCALALLVGALVPINLDLGVPVFALLASCVYTGVRQLEQQARQLLQQRASDAQRRVLIQSVLQDSFDGILVTDAAGIIEIANRAAGRLLGCTPASMHGKPIGTLLPIFNMPPASLETGTDAEHQMTPVETTFAGPSGEVSILEFVLSRSLVHSPGGKREAARVVQTYTFRDISERRRAEDGLRGSEQRLRQSEAHFAAAQRVGAVGSFVRDLHTDLLTGTPQFYTIFGLDPDSPGDWVSFWQEAVSPEDRWRIDSHLDDVVRTGRRPPPVEFAFQRADGVRRFALRDADVVVDEQGDPIALLGVVRDITERRVAEARARLLHEASLAIAEAEDLETALSLVLRLVCETAGWRYAEAWVPDANGAHLVLYAVWNNGEPRLARIAEETRKVVFVPGQGAVGRAYASGRPEWLTYGNLIRELDARAFYAVPICRSAEPLAVLGFAAQEEASSKAYIIETISAVAAQLGTALARKRAEDELKRNASLLERAQRIAHLGTIVLDLATDELQCSQEVYLMFGVDPATFHPTMAKLDQLLVPEDHGKLLAVRDQIVKGNCPEPFEYRIQCPDGGVRYIYRENEIIYDAKGKPVKFIGTLHDVTQMRVAELRHRELQKQLLHSQKLEAIGTLAGGVAHELNNALMPICALSKMMLKSMPPKGEDREDMAIIAAASDRARNFVQQILSFSRKHDSLTQDAPRKLIDLVDLLKHSSQMLRLTVPTTARLYEEISPVPLVLADADELHQVVVNLVTNAAQALGSAIGTITIGAAPTPHTVSSAEDEANWVRLWIADTGCGMDARTVERVFEPFFTTKDVGEGTGLGLSVVHGIIADHGGHIEVQSEPGMGTKFTIYLPAAPMLAA